MKKKAENCWEFTDCPAEIRNNCDAYLHNLGKKCYLVAPDLCPQRDTEFNHCWECEWCEEVAPEFCRKSRERITKQRI